MCTTRERSAAWWRSYGYLAPPFDGCARPVRIIPRPAASSAAAAHPRPPAQPPRPSNRAATTATTRAPAAGAARVRERPPAADRARDAGPRSSAPPPRSWRAAVPQQGFRPVPQRAVVQVAARPRRTRVGTSNLGRIDQTLALGIHLKRDPACLQRSSHRGPAHAGASLRSPLRAASRAGPAVGELPYAQNRRIIAVRMVGFATGANGHIFVNQPGLLGRIGLIVAYDRP